MFPAYLLIGSELSVEFFSSLAAELREKIGENKKTNRAPPKDLIKILWLELKPYFKIDFLTKLESDQGVKIVFEETNYVYWDKLDPQKPYESLAKNLLPAIIMARLNGALWLPRCLPGNTR